MILTMGIVNLPTLQQYWCKSWPFQSFTLFRIMSRDRFLLILKFLHLNNNRNIIPRGQQGHDKIFKIRPFVDRLIDTFQKLYQLKRELSLDEYMISYMGFLSFLQYLPKKPHKWGMKAWVLAESKTGYTFNWSIYTGKDADDCGPLAMRVVLKLVEKLHHQGHHLYFDNFYTSPGNGTTYLETSYEVFTYLLQKTN